MPAGRVLGEVRADEPVCLAGEPRGCTLAEGLGPCGESLVTGVKSSFILRQPAISQVADGRLVWSWR